jgi:hypothetical protein
MNNYECPDCGQSGEPRAKDCCDTCIGVFFTNDPSDERHAVWLDSYDSEVLRGFVGELLEDNSSISDGDRKVLDRVYTQLLL